MSQQKMTVFSQRKKTDGCNGSKFSRGGVAKQHSLATVYVHQLVIVSDVICMA